MSSSSDELGNLASGLESNMESSRESGVDGREIRVSLAPQESGEESDMENDGVRASLVPYVQQSDAFFIECKERKTSYKEHAIRLGITATSFIGSALFLFGVEQFIEETKGDDQVWIDTGIALGIIGLTLSALPLAGYGVTTAQDMQPSSDVEEAFLEPTKQSKVENFLRVSAGLGSATPIAGLSYYVLINSNPLLKWGGTITAFLGLAFGTVPSMLKIWKSAPNELEAKEGGLSADQLRVIKRMHEIVLERIESNQYKNARLAHDSIPKNSCELLNFLLAEPAPSYGRGLDAFIIGGTGISFIGMGGYAGSTGLFVNPLFKKLPNIPGILADDVTTLLFIVAFGNLMRLSCKGGFSDLYRAMAAINSKEGILNFIKSEIYAYPFFPVIAPTVAVFLGVLGAFTGFTNAATCYAMTLPVLNAITFGYWGKWGLETMTEVIRWVTAVCGFINSDFFNGRGSIIAVLNVFLLQYGHFLLDDEKLKDVLKNFNGSQLYLRRFKEKLPVGKAILLVNSSCDRPIIENILQEATKGDDKPSITINNWDQVIESIEEQRDSHTVTEPQSEVQRSSHAVTESPSGVRLSSNLFSFSTKTRENYEKTSLLNDDCEPTLLLIPLDSEQQGSGQQNRYGSFYRDEEAPAVKGLEKSASYCAVM